MLRREKSRKVVVQLILVIQELQLLQVYTIHLLPAVVG